MPDELRKSPGESQTDHHQIIRLMQKKTKWILIGLTAIVIMGIAVILALRYFPFHKLMKRPSSVDMAFVNKPQAPGSAPFSLYFDFEVDTTAKTPAGLYRGI